MECSSFRVKLTCTIDEYKMTTVNFNRSHLGNGLTLCPFFIVNCPAYAIVGLESICFT